MNREEPMLDLAGGDVGMSRHLAKALNIIVGSPGLAPDLKAQMQEILQGKGTIRDLVHSESFARLGDAVIPKALEDFAATSPEEIQRKAELGNAILESYRNQDPETSPPAEPSPSSSPEQSPTSAPQGTPSTSASEVGSSGNHPASHVIPGTRKPNRDRIVTPDDLDDDDLYFQDRNQRGWLE
ncbi:hypothetical protein ACIHDR_30655 [Nocardia sp. NPDC052278]|uniref:hypothetical protein n=1 Tax=unclassified Nocardia TaxID=2637762 RepID=UPI00368C4ECE